ncbi:hypothetical protein BV22DRAFT_1022397, partial [Leucogyrophana mollusca]
HAQACNIIEHIFGVTKRQFALMVTCPEYPEETQAKFVTALAVLHNFICVYNPKDTDSVSDKGNSSTDQLDVHLVPDFYGAEVTHNKRNRANIRRDNIAQAMWDSYQQIYREQED